MTDLAEEQAKLDKKVEEKVKKLEGFDWVSVKPSGASHWGDNHKLRYQVHAGWLADVRHDCFEDCTTILGRVSDLLLKGYEIEPLEALVFFDKVMMGRSTLMYADDYLHKYDIHLSAGARINLARIAGMLHGVKLAGHAREAALVAGSLYRCIKSLGSNKTYEVGGRKIPSRKTLIAGEDEFNFRFMMAFAIDPEHYSKVWQDISDGKDLSDFSAMDECQRQLREKLKIIDEFDGRDIREWAPNVHSGYVHYSCGMNGGIIDHLHLWDGNWLSRIEQMKDPSFSDIYSSHT